MDTPQKSKEDIVAGGLNQNQIDAYTKKHGEGNITLITIKAKQGDQHFWFKKPTMMTINAVSKVGQSDMSKGMEIYFNDCYLRGNKDVMTNDVDTWTNLIPKLDELVETYDSEVKKF